MVEFSGLGLNLGNLSRLSNAQTRSIPRRRTSREAKRRARAACPPTGLPANAGPGPRPGLEGLALHLSSEPGQTFTLADIAGSGAIQQVWMTLARGKWRHTILRAYWDDQEQPSVECPAMRDFF